MEEGWMFSFGKGKLVQGEARPEKDRRNGREAGKVGIATRGEDQVGD